MVLRVKRSVNEVIQEYLSEFTKEELIQWFQRVIFETPRERLESEIIGIRMNVAFWAGLREAYFHRENVEEIAKEKLAARIAEDHKKMCETYKKVAEESEGEPPKDWCA